MASHILPTFQNEGRFVFSRPQQFDEKARRAGEPVIVTAANHRRVRLLFDRRKIEYAENKNTGAAGKGK